ncbi:hemagglutinin, partial [Escherichia coli]|nr:hemagglutinin [Escherichia coli]MBZ9162550.1 hemagglutinin [Escherichia coli]
MEDSELSGVEYAEKRAEIDKYRTESKLTDKSRAYYGSPEYAALNKLQAERSRIFSAYVSTHGAVSVGNGKSITRQITSVAAGSEDTDAVNVAQLRDLQTVTEKADAALDKRITNNTSAITKNLQVVNSNKEEISNINKTTKILDERVTANTQTAEEHKLLISENRKQISTNALGIRENTQRIRDEGQARIRGDRETLRAATGYTDMRVNGLERNTN